MQAKLSFTHSFPYHTEVLTGQGQVLPVSHWVPPKDYVSHGLGQAGGGWGSPALPWGWAWTWFPCCRTTVNPREKLEVLERTYGEIEATVSRVLGREHKLPMDDLLPLLIYVVSRAR